MNKPVKSAKGLKGILIKSISSDTVFFRVYDEDHTFIDYNIHHYDMEIAIEEDAYIYKTDDGNFYIDYSPESYGLSENDE